MKIKLDLSEDHTIEFFELLSPLLIKIYHEHSNLYARSSYVGFDLNSQTPSPLIIQKIIELQGECEHYLEITNSVIHLLPPNVIVGILSKYATRKVLLGEDQTLLELGLIKLMKHKNLEAGKFYCDNAYLHHKWFRVGLNFDIDINSNNFNNFNNFISEYDKLVCGKLKWDTTLIFNTSLPANFFIDGVSISYEPNKTIIHIPFHRDIEFVKMVGEKCLSTFRNKTK